jgi:hypothetical protein
LLIMKPSWSRSHGWPLMCNPATTEGQDSMVRWGKAYIHAVAVSGYKEGTGAEQASKRKDLDLGVCL